MQLISNLSAGLSTGCQVACLQIWKQDDDVQLLRRELLTWKSPELK